MLIARNIRSAGGQTSMRLEPLFWDLFAEICKREGIRPYQLISKIDQICAQAEPQVRRTEATRAFIANYFAEAATEEGHARAKHGTFSKQSGSLGQSSRSDIVCMDIGTHRGEISTQAA